MKLDSGLAPRRNVDPGRSELRPLDMTTSTSPPLEDDEASSPRPGNWSEYGSSGPARPSPGGRGRYPGPPEGLPGMKEALSRPTRAEAEALGYMNEAGRDSNADRRPAKASRRGPGRPGAPREEGQGGHRLSSGPPRIPLRHSKTPTRGSLEERPGPRAIFEGDHVALTDKGRAAGPPQGRGSMPRQPLLHPHSRPGDTPRRRPIPRYGGDSISLFWFTKGTAGMIGLSLPREDEGLGYGGPRTGTGAS